MAKTQRQTPKYTKGQLIIINKKTATVGQVKWHRETKNWQYFVYPYIVPFFEYEIDRMQPIGSNIVIANNLVYFHSFLYV